MGAGFADHVFCEGGDLLHEFVALNLAALHFVELRFPVAGHRGRGELLDMHLFAKFDQAQPFAADVEFTAIAGDVFLAEQALDCSGACGGCAEATFGHRFTQFVVVNNEFTCTFHRCEEGRFGVAGRRLGFFVQHVDRFGLRVFALSDGDELVLLCSNACHAAIDGEVTWLDQCFTISQESVFFVAVVDRG